MESSRDIFILMTVAVTVGNVCYWYLVGDIRDSAKISMRNAQYSFNNIIIRSKMSIVPRLRYPRLLLTSATFHISISFPQKTTCHSHENFLSLQCPPPLTTWSFILKYLLFGDFLSVFYLELCCECLHCDISL